MNKVDDILEQLKGQQPVIDDPDTLTERIMDSLPDEEPATPGNGGVARRRPLWQWLSMAASLLLIIGIGTTLMRRQDAEPTTEALVAKAESVMVTTHEEPTVPQMEEAVSKAVEMKYTRTAPKPQQEEPQGAQPVKAKEPAYQTVDEPNLHYAAYNLKKDTLPYQDPARVDEFIAKMAAYNNVMEAQLSCSAPMDSNAVSKVYVFPDKQELNVFSRLLQVACWYSDETPGYLLNFSHQQFFFELKDMRKQLKYLWIAEHINGKILLYCTHSPINAKTTSACYQEYRDELMHTKNTHIKTADI